MWCTVHERDHGPCAICHATNATPRICANCAAAPENAGWVSQWEDVSTVANVDAGRYGELRLGQVIGELPALEATPKQRQVFELLLTQKVLELERKDRRGRRRGTRRVVTVYTTREIAHLVGVGHQYVARLRRRLFYGG